MKKAHDGASLVVQWLRLLAPNAGGQVRSLVKLLDSIGRNQDLAQPNKQIYKERAQYQSPRFPPSGPGVGSAFLLKATASNGNQILQFLLQLQLSLASRNHYSFPLFLQA